MQRTPPCLLPKQMDGPDHEELDCEYFIAWNTLTQNPYSLIAGKVCMCVLLYLYTYEDHISTPLSLQSDSMYVCVGKGDQYDW